MSFEKEPLALHKRFPVKITKGVNVLSGVRNYPYEKDKTVLPTGIDFQGLVINVINLYMYGIKNSRLFFLANANFTAS